ncbi:Ubiquitinyl hydrolase 1 [Bertholletia excelsa]
MALQMTWQPNLLNQRRKTGPPLGLKNLGNSCYLNSVLQCLTHTPPLANYCLRNQHSSFCKPPYPITPGKKRECPFCILERRIARSLSVDLTLDTPSKMNSCLRIFAEHFRFGRQEDAHEFLRYVIDACHNTCLRLKKLQHQRRNGKGCNGSTNELSSGSTVVKEIFGGALQSQVKCLSCGVESNKVDEIMDLSLDVLHILDGNNKYKCENCKKLVAAKKQMSLHQAPNVLVIQLKIDKVIAFEEFLVLSSYMSKASQDPNPEYNLFGTIVHSGFSPDSGHYYAYIKDAMGHWYCCNDSYVKLTNLQEVLSEKVYILFFSRTKQRPQPASTVSVSNGLKSEQCNGSDASKNRKVADSEKVLYKHPGEKDNLTRNKANKVPANLHASLNSITDSGIKKISATVNGKIVVNRGQSDRKNEDLRASVSAEKGEKRLAMLNGNGMTKSKTIEAIDGVKNGAFPLANGNYKTKSTPIKSVEAGLYENGHKRNEVAVRGINRHESRSGGVDISGSKRKSQDEDTCILFAKDNHSREKVEAFKTVLGKEVSSFLRSCGWTEEVHNSMRSKKKVCLQEALSDTSSSNNVLKKKLITDAKGIFISQIPESLKEKLIERLRLFARRKNSLPWRGKLSELSSP